MLGEHPITPVLLATDLAAAREFYHDKLGLQIVREDQNVIVFSCGSSTHLDMTKSITGTAGQQTQAAWQVRDIRTEMAELRTHGIKVEDFDARGQRPKSWRTRPSWTRKAARPALDIALEERECESALLRNGR
jgi:catechol 2,3-dioxygenase-like lactoylglutathione lyase family enzyme